MSLWTDTALLRATEYAARHARVGLTRSQARLYSQRTRLEAGQPGLRVWSPESANEYLEEAIRLLQAARIERESGHETWGDHVRRAGEILEWLSAPGIAPDVWPTALLAAAAYQLAGYPAQALGLLSGVPLESDSALLRSFLKGDFPALLDGVVAVWTRDVLLEPRAPSFEGERAFEQFVADTIVRETVRSFGIAAASMRWGDDGRLTSAIAKLDEIAGLLARSTDPFSWLLAHLTAEVLRVYQDTALRQHVDLLTKHVTAAGKLALERYLRRAYLQCRALAWPSQRRGIAALVEAKSFALCTPTGSGKTTIAELAILHDIFLSGTDTRDGFAPLVLYLTPSRALAAEVEAKLASVLRGLSTSTIQVTGLYGGTDWGPSDAWLTSDEATVLICTYEKAEALLRFLGPLFMRRVGLIVVDEAHNVQWPEDGGFRPNESMKAFSDYRPLKLESLLTRLLAFPGPERRMIALSAVAGGMEDTLARWLTGDADAEAAKVSYRSMRQLVGRLECFSTGFEIHYDVLNGQQLEFQAGEDETPYVRNPFPPVPGWRWDPARPEVSLRAPALWAALHLVVSGHQRRQGVMVFVPQKPHDIAKEFLHLLDTVWSAEDIPDFFSVPEEEADYSLWQRCLSACEDYFGLYSYEYRLLRHGVVLHHGKMPGAMSRLLVEVVEKKIIHLVVATSTLAEGVNLPFETVLVYSPFRGASAVFDRELVNLIGRAGRPGNGTEGRTLFVMPGGDRRNRRREAFRELVRTLASTETSSNVGARSPLAHVIGAIYSDWRRLTRYSGTIAEFEAWLESTVPTSATLEYVAPQSAIEGLDVLDQMLIAVRSEFEATESAFPATAAFENHLQQVWRRTFASCASQNEETWGRYFIARGRAVTERIYPDAGVRRRLYMSSLPPRAGTRLLSIVPEVTEQLQAAQEFFYWSNEERLAFLERLIELLSSVPPFAPISGPKKARWTWRTVLRWWFRAEDRPRPNSPAQLSEWYKHAAQSLLYRFNWGLGSVISLAVNEAHAGELRSTSLEEWPETGLPWAVIWLKELVNWGTLNPVAAHLLAERRAQTRDEAESMAEQYNDFVIVRNIGANGALHPALIREWAEERFGRRSHLERRFESRTIEVKLMVEFPPDQHQWRVLPISMDPIVRWVDPAGYVLAESTLEAAGGRVDLTWDYLLDSTRREILASPFLAAPA